jgi:hypothetical protein
VTTPVQTTASWPDVDGRGNVVVPDTGARPMSLDCVGMERSVVRSQSHPPEWNSGSTVKGLRRALGASGNSYPPFRLPRPAAQRTFNRRPVRLRSRGRWRGPRGRPPTGPSRRSRRAGRPPPAVRGAKSQLSQVDRRGNALSGRRVGVAGEADLQHADSAGSSP